MIRRPLVLGLCVAVLAAGALTLVLLARTFKTDHPSSSSGGAPRKDGGVVDPGTSSNHPSRTHAPSRRSSPPLPSDSFEAVLEDILHQHSLHSPAAPFDPLLESSVSSFLFTRVGHILALDLLRRARSDPAERARLVAALLDGKRPKVLREFLLYVTSALDPTDPASDVASAARQVLESESDDDLRFAAALALTNPFSFADRTSDRVRSDVQSCARSTDFFRHPGMTQILCRVGSESQSSDRVRYQAIHGLVNTGIPILRRLARTISRTAEGAPLQERLKKVPWDSLKGIQESRWEDVSRFAEERTEAPLEKSAALSIALSASYGSETDRTRALAVATVLSELSKAGDGAPLRQDFEAVLVNSVRSEDPVLALVAIEGLAKTSSLSLPVLGSVLSDRSTPVHLKLAAIESLRQVESSLPVLAATADNPDQPPIVRSLAAKARSERTPLR